MRQEPQGDEERKSFVRREPHLDTAAGRLVAVEGVRCPFWVFRCRLTPKASVGVEEPLESNPQVRAVWLTLRTCEHGDDRLLDLVSFEGFMKTHSWVYNA